ncbi:MAG: hypothetical protein ACPGXK_02390 [Phycisphaerae bacterium]
MNHFSQTKNSLSEARYLALAVICSAIGFAIPADVVQATVVVPMSLEQVADHTAVAVAAKITGKESYWTGSPPRIETRLTIQVDEVLKGDSSLASTPLTFTVPGGQVGQMNYRIAGAPEWTVGDEWILMMHQSYKTHPIVGIWHGAFRVRETPSGSTQVVTAGGNDVTHIAKKGTSQSYVRTGSQHHGAHADLTPKHSPSPRQEMHARFVKPDSKTQDGMTKAQFLDAVRPVLLQSRKIGNGKTFAVRQAVTLMPTSLKQASDDGVTREQMHQRSATAREGKHE